MRSTDEVHVVRLDTAPRGATERSRTTLDGHTDAVVVGGGLTGVVAALHLAPQG